MSFPWAEQYKPKHPFMRWLDDRLPLPRMVYNATGKGYPVPRNLNFFWNFGDGTSQNTGSTNQVSHTYALAGTYTVTVSATATNGQTASSTGTIVIP